MNKPFAFIFPGQGSQSVAMLSNLASEYPQVKETFEQASDILGIDLWKLTQAGPVEKLNQTEHTQPALLAAGCSVWKIWKTLEVPSPALLAGHSLGEYTALVCAESLHFDDAIKLVAERGRLMQAAVKPGDGAMAAIIGLDNQKVAKVCEESSSEGVVEPANFNAIGQVVIAGEVAAVKLAMQQAKSAGAKLAKLIPVSAPSHCALMLPAAEKLGTYLASIEIQSPKIPVIHNVDVTSHLNAEDIRTALVKQLYSPVRWVETIQLIQTKGVDTFYECGPGKVLCGLNKRIDKTLTSIDLSNRENFKEMA